MPRTKEAFEAMRETTRKKIETAALSLYARKGLAVTVEEKESIGKAIAELNNLEREYQTLHDEPNQMLFDEDEKQVLSNKLISRYIDKITVFGRNEFEISWL